MVLWYSLKIIILIYYVTRYLSYVGKKAPTCQPHINYSEMEYFCPALKTNFSNCNSDFSENIMFCDIFPTLSQISQCPLLSFILSSFSPSFFTFYKMS